jgi:predicted dehydrogenase
MAGLNVGIVGLGDIADLHARGYQNRSDAEIVAVCDRDEDRAVSHALDWGADSYHTDFEQMLERADLDAVEILTPHRFHHAQAVRALQSGLHVCVERPLALSLEDADQLIQEAKQADRVLQVFEPCLFHKPLLDARNLIDAGEIGNPTGVHINATIGSSSKGAWNFDADSPPTWRFERGESGTAPMLFDIGYQSFCTALFLIGSVDRIQVWRSTKQVNGGWTLDTPTNAMWKHLQNECYGSLSLTHAPERTLETSYHPVEFEITITGTRGDLQVLRTPDPTRFDAPVELRRSGRAVQYGDMPEAYEESFSRATDNFVQACAGETTPLLRGSEAKQLLVLTLAFHQSVHSGKTVTLEHG